MSEEQYIALSLDGSKVILTDKPQLEANEELVDGVIVESENKNIEKPSENKNNINTCLLAAGAFLGGTLIGAGSLMGVALMNRKEKKCVHVVETEIE